MSKFSFGVPQPETGPSMSSGLKPYEHEIHLEGGDTVRFVPLHGVHECLALWVHAKKVKYNGGFKYVPVGSMNKALFPPVVSPFETSPDDAVNKIKLARFMLVYVLDGIDVLKHKVAYIELRSNKKKNGSFDGLANWEKEMGQTVEGVKCSISRQGKGLKDTIYQSSVLKTYEFTDEDNEVIAEQAEEVGEYLRSVYARAWDLEEFERVYNLGVVGDNAPEQEEMPVADDESDIPF